MSRRRANETPEETLVRVGGTIMAAGAKEIATLTAERDQLQAQLAAERENAFQREEELEAAQARIEALQHELSVQEDLYEAVENRAHELEQAAIAREEALEAARALVREAHLVLGGVLVPPPALIQAAFRRKVIRLMAQMEQHAWLREAKQEAP
jgi:septal ring factor EnvC (AmiA/AmiB activator)